MQRSQTSNDLTMATTVKAPPRAPLMRGLPGPAASATSDSNLFNEDTAVPCLRFLEAAALDRSGRPMVGSPVPASEELTYFHSLVLPQISLCEMAEELVDSRIAINWTTVAIAAALFARFDAITPVTAHVTHRLFATCVVVAAKAHQDTTPSNGLFGSTVGMRGAELTLLEFELAATLDWRFVVEASDPAWRRLAAQAAASPSGSALGGWSFTDAGGEENRWLATPEHATQDSPADGSPCGPHDLSAPVA